MYVQPTQSESTVLKTYTDTGNRLKGFPDSGMADIECGVTDFVNAVKACTVAPAVFAYLDGSSGLGKTQLAFALHRKVLYVPWGEPFVHQ